VLVGALVVFVLGNLVPVLTADHGLFVAARAGRAIPRIVSGVAVSAALCMPLGALVGQALGWRGSFVAVVVALIATLVVPSVPSTGGGTGSQSSYAFAPRVLAVLVLSSLASASIADRNAARSLIVATTGVAMALMALCIFGAIACFVAPALLALGIAFGSFAGGVATSTFGASAAVITSLITTVSAVAVAWATGFLEPPVAAYAEEPAPELA
jgi:MFS transporter, DHA1 family, inner membrane transport protein